jgi:DNA polymerase III sliding clamp (beta) subunit (PCNA family)
LHHSWFDEFQFDASQDTAQIGIHTATFYKVINIRQEQQVIEISSEGKDIDTINIHFTKGKKNFNKSFGIPTIDLDNELMDIPQDDTSVDLVIDTKRLSELASELILFSEILTLIFSEEGIEFMASGTEGKMKSSIDLDEVNEYAVGENMRLKQSYSLKYLNIMCHFGKLSSEISMGFSEQRPMHLLYNLDEKKECDKDTHGNNATKSDNDDDDHDDDNDDDNDDDDDDDDDNDETLEKSPENYVSFYLAPRIDDEE